MALKATTGKLEMTLTSGNCRRRITIPQVGARLIDLITAVLPAGFDRPIVAVHILPRLPSGVDRASFIVADPFPGAAIQASDYTTHGEPVATGEGWATVSVGDLDSYLQAATDSPAIAIIHW